MALWRTMAMFARINDAPQTTDPLDSQVELQHMSPRLGDSYGTHGYT